VHELLDHHLGAGRAVRRAAEHLAHRGKRLIQRFAHNHALSGGQPGRLDHHRRAHFAQVRLGFGEPVEGVEAGGGDAVALHQRLGEALGALDGRRLFARPEDGEPPVREVVRDPRGQRRLGAHDGEVDAVGLHPRRERLDLAGRQGDGGGPAHPAVGVGHKELGAGCVAPQLPQEGVLAPAVAHDQDLHECRSSGGGSAPVRG
jgi:hypothetical protein